MPSKNELVNETIRLCSESKKKIQRLESLHWTWIFINLLAMCCFFFAQNVCHVLPKLFLQLKIPLRVYSRKKAQISVSCLKIFVLFFHLMSYGWVFDLSELVYGNAICVHDTRMWHIWYSMRGSCYDVWNMLVDDQKLAKIQMSLYLTCISSVVVPQTNSNVTFSFNHQFTRERKKHTPTRQYASCVVVFFLRLQ